MTATAAVALFAPEPLRLDTVNLAAAWAACPPLPDGHPCLDWSLTDQVRLSAVTGHEGLTALRLTDGQHLTGLALIRPDRPAVQIFGSGDFVPADLPVGGDVLLLTVQPEAAAAIAAAGLPAVACLTPERIEAALLHWQGRYARVLIAHSAARIDEIPENLRDFVLPLDDLPDMASTAQTARADLLAAVDGWHKKHIPTEWPAPAGYQPEREPAPPYPLDALPPLARDAAAAIAYHVDAPVALAAQCVLGTLTYLAQRSVNAPDISHSPNGMPTSLFILTEGDSGERKTHCQALADRVPNEVERARMLDYRSEMASYRAMSHRDREGIAAPICPKSMYSDATIEPVISALINGAANVMLSSDEAGQFFGGHSLQSDTARAALGNLTRLWSSGIAERTRSAGNAEGSGVAYDCRLSISLLGQRAVIGECLRDPVLRGQGLLPRFIFAAPESLAGTRLHRPTPDDNPYRDPRLHRYWDRCRALLGVSEDGLPPDLSDQPEADRLATDATGRRVLPLDREAEKLAAALYEETERAQGRGGKFEFLRPFAARAEENARRVATVLAFFEGQPSITPEITRGACQIVRYSLNEWLRYQNAPETDPLTQAAQRLEFWLVEKTRATGGAPVDRSHAQQSGPAAARKNTQTLDACLSILTSSHRVRTEKIGRKTVIVVNPALLA